MCATTCCGVDVHEWRLAGQPRNASTSATGVCTAPMTFRCRAAKRLE